MAFSEYMNFITDVIVIKTLGGIGGRDKTLPDIYYPIEGVGGDKLILFCFCCDETQGKNNIHHFEINQNTKQ